jgi:catechol 2,3-dioxygenase-like lactoylglutathione lyase family enzyme
MPAQFRPKPKFTASLFSSPSPMIKHVSMDVRDLARAKRFYDAALKPLGYACLSEDAASLGYGRDAAGLWILAAKNPVPADDGGFGPAGVGIAPFLPGARAALVKA